MRCLLTIALSGCLYSQIVPDTAALASELNPVRAAREVPKGWLSRIQAKFVDWTDTRVQAGRTAQEMQAELKTAGLEAPEGGFSIEEERPYWSSVGTLEIREIRAAPDWLILQLGIGVICGDYPTLVFYRRDSQKRVGWVHPNDLDRLVGWSYAAVAVGARDGKGSSLMAFGANTTWCTSTMIGLSLQIARSDDTALKVILSKFQSARYWNKEPVYAAVAGENVEFDYLSRMPNATVMARDAIERYLVRGETATRVVPIAPNVGAFIAEWINVPKVEAVAFSTPQAMLAHDQVQTWTKDGLYEFDNDHIRRCQGNVRRWEVTLTFEKPGGEAVGTKTFVVTESGKNRLKMEHVIDGPTASKCPAVKLPDLLGPLRP